MNDYDDDKLMAAANALSKEETPGRDLWPDIADAIEQPARRQRTPMFVQAAAVLLLVGASSATTYFVMKDQQPGAVVTPPDLVFDHTAFGNNYDLGQDFQDARQLLVDELRIELRKLSPEARATVEANVTLVHESITQINEALESDPDNIVLQGQLMRAYRDELALIRRVSGLTRNVMIRNDI